MADYNVVMTQPVSIRFRDERVVKQLKAEAKMRDKSLSAMAEELIDEALRIRRHPLITFRDHLSGRRAGTIAGPEVWEVMGYLLDVKRPSAKRIAEAAEHLNVHEVFVRAALAYYAEYSEEIDDWIATNDAVLEEEEALWLKQRDLLSS
jgi:hypothetical protein